jgi:hypothetical protein
VIVATIPIPVRKACRPVLSVIALAAIFTCPSADAQETQGDPKSTEQRAFSVGITTGVSDQVANPITWLVGFRVDPGQGREHGPSFGASLWPTALGAGYAVILGDAGYAMRVQGDHMALVPRASVAPVVAFGDDAFATLGWSLGVGLELRSKGSSTGVRLDGSVLGGLDPNTDVLMLLGLHFIVGGR